MKTYTIHYTMEAKYDIMDVYVYIANELFEPETAEKYRDEIIEACRKLCM